MDVARLIREVHKRNGIWDHRSSSHYMRDAVTCLWNEIAIILEAPVDAVKAKWRNLRDTYTAECRKMYKQSRNKEPVIKSKWVWFQSMDFLRPHLKRLRELQESKQQLINASAYSLRNTVSHNRRRFKKIFKEEQDTDFSYLDENDLIENVEVDIMPNETLLQAVTSHLEEDDENDSADDISSSDTTMGNDSSMNISLNPSFAYNHYSMLSNGNSSRNNNTNNRKRNHLQISSPFSMSAEGERKRRRQLIEEEILTLRPSEVDDTFHFLISLREPLKSLTLDRQMYVRYKIQELLFNETGNSHNTSNETQPDVDTLPEIFTLGTIKKEPREQ